jgi:hypothetical protein
VTCVHPESTLYEFDVPGIGPMKLCWECRRDIVLRLHLYDPVGVVCVDLGTIGRECDTCKGEYTSTWAGSCNCPGRRDECEAKEQALRRWRTFADMCICKPTEERAA